jgi:hypothetical protein
MGRRASAMILGGPRIVGAAALAISLAGCSKGVQISPPVVMSNWSDVVAWTEKGSQAVGGIDFATVQVQGFDRPNMGETLVAVWGDLHPTHWENGHQDGGPGHPDEFQASSIVDGIEPGRRLQFDVTLHRDDPETLTLYRHSYDLNAGTLFLVSFAKGFPVVKQLKRNMSRSQLTGPILKQTATSDSEIIQFFKDQNGHQSASS